MLKDDETEAEAEALQGFFYFVGDYPLYAYNEKFDVGFVNNYYPRVYMGGWYGHRGYGRRWR
jgi:DNA polymerase III epsilon subunit-like protein